MTDSLIEPVAGERAEVLDQLLAQRWSCRSYRPDPVPREVVEQLLTMAQRTASWCNTQPWQTIVLSGAATDRFREALSAHVATGAEGAFDFEAPGQYQGVYRDRRRESGWQLYDAVGIEKGDRAASTAQMLQNFRFFDAPHVAIVTTDAQHATYGAVDGGLYVSTFLLAAQSLGLGTVPQAAVAGYSPFVREYLGIGEDRKILVTIPFGYPDAEHPINGYRTDRADLSEVATFIDE
ncbi:nitroreductase [Gordonia desulfuricans]|uniref:Nitroreductase n=1 Tax=Gordonia desulfuricans TaxID=89051 RepID=A0A7K3LRN7_9ACTN|nr:nitroreductase [Gordonia desulfuricans]NDK90935.1 nitroreductase [Gordonia desulfuricans]